MRKLWAIAVLVLLSGCSEPSQKTAERRAIRDAEAAVTQLLQDPGSATFGEDHFVALGGELICGTVNAKNGFGGYTGQTMWMAWQDAVYVASPDQTREMQACCAIVMTAVEANEAPLYREGFSASCGAASTRSPMPFNFSAP